MTPEQLFTPLTYDDAKRTIYNAFAVVGVNTTGWKPGFVMRTMIAAVAVIVVVFSELIALIGKAAYLDFAEGVWLTWLARYVYGTERILATFATGTVTLDNTLGGGLYTFAPGELIVYNPDTEKQYQNTTAIELNPGQKLTGVAIVAIEAGSESTSIRGTIVASQATLTDCTITNPQAVVGEDEETDPNLRIRCKEVLGARSAMGPEDAYNAAARRAKLNDGTPINVNRTKLRKDAKGNIYIYVAKFAGAVSGVLSDADSELACVNLEIQKTAAPLGITARTSSAVAQVTDWTATLYVTDTKGYSDEDLATAVEVALARYFGTVPIGGFIISGAQGKLFLDDVRAHMRVIDTVFRVVLSTSADITLQPNQFPVMGELSLTVSVQKQQTLSSFFESDIRAKARP